MSFQLNSLATFTASACVLRLANTTQRSSPETEKGPASVEQARVAKVRRGRNLPRTDLLAPTLEFPARARPAPSHMQPG